ncbi:hypothetical protein MMC27_007118 [Xylographa pallens]|nr:hypothetical protein [Xylographa pallens]
MDPLSITASIVAVIQISQQLFDLCQTYYKGVKNARNDIKRLRDEVTALSDVLTQISDLADEPGADALATLDIIKGPLQSCGDDLSLLSQRLDPGHGKEMKQFGFRALKWPFSTKEVEKTLAVIDRHKNMFTLALTADQTSLILSVSQDVSDIKQGLARTQISVEGTQADSAAYRSERYRTSMVKWLTVTDPSFNYRAALKKHQPSTGEWFLELEQFRKWKDTRSSLLWLHGIPGCGKTILSSTIVKHLISEYTSQPKIVIAYFYFDFNTGEKQNVSNCLSSLVGQICHQSGLVLEVLEELYEKCSNGNQKVAPCDLIKVMRIYATGGDPQDIYIVLDALDECPEGDLRDEVLKLITDLCSWSASKIHLIVTSRQESDIQEALIPLLTWPAIPIQGARVRGDIEAYVDHQITTYLRRLSTDLKEEIKDTLLQGANGMFRWVFCQLQVLKKCPPIRSAIRKALRNLPPTLDGVYTRVLESIEDETCQELAGRCLVWLAFSRVPLCLEELAEAAVVGTESFDPEDRISDPQFILELLGSLVVVASDEYDLENSPTIAEWVVHNGIGAAGLGVIRLAHFSVKEFLISERIVQSAVSKFALDAALAHGHIAEACLLYLDSYQQLESGAMPYVCSWNMNNFPISTDRGFYPLLEYACSFWWHLRQTPLRTQRALDYIIWKLFHKNVTYGLPDWIITNSFTGAFCVEDMSPLHLFSLFGIEGAVQLELERGAHVNARNNWQETALHLAVRLAHHRIVRLLLEYGATSSAENIHGFIPLMGALEYHHYQFDPLSDVSIESSLAIINLLLSYEDKMHDCQNLTYPEKQILPSTILINKSRGHYWITPIHFAARYGSVEHCKFLLDSGAEVKCQDALGRNALHHVIKGCAPVPRRLEIVKLLLDHGLDVLAKNDDGQTVLELAINDGHLNLDVVKTNEERADDVLQKYDHAALQSMETARQERRKAEIRRLMIECPIDPPIVYNEGDYGYALWKDFYSNQA